MMNFRKVWSEYCGFSVFVVCAFLFFGGMIFLGLHGDKKRAAERSCAYLEFTHAEADWFGDDAYCINDEGSVHVLLKDAEERDHLNRVARRFVEQLFGPIESVFDFKVINCVPSRFNQDGTPSHVLCMEKRGQQVERVFCEEINSKYEATSYDQGCCKYQHAQAYALSAGAKLNIPTDKMTNPDPSEFREDCVILNLDPHGLPLRRMCKLVNNKHLEIPPSCSIRLEHDMHVDAAYDVPSCDDFDKVWTKRHPSRS